jgi:hypothetical protein
MSNATITIRPSANDLRIIDRIIAENGRPGLNLKAVDAIRIALADWAANHPEAAIEIVSIDTQPEHDPYNTGRSTRSAIRFDPAERRVWIVQQDGATGTPADEWHGRVLSQTFAGHPIESRVRDYLSRDGLNLLRRVAAGHTIRWNGSDHVGHLSDDAEAAWDELLADLEGLGEGDSGSYGYSDAGDWYGACSPEELGVSAETTDDQLEALAKKHDADALASEHLVVDGTNNYLESLRSDLRAAAED